MKLAALLVLLASCGDNTAPNYTMKPRQAEAMDLVWFGVYTKNIDPPLVNWVEGGRLNCPGGMSFMSTDGTCAFGEFTDWNYTIHVAWLPGQKFSDVSFAHELCHAKAWAETSDSDGGHTGPCFVGLSSHVAAAQDALLGAGL